MIFFCNYNHITFVICFAFVLINKCIAKRKKIDLLSVTRDNIDELRRLNDLIYPFQYPSTYYEEVINNFDDLARLAYYEDQLAGAVTCRETYEDKAKLYIITIGCLPEYRRCGVGSALLQYIIDLPKQRRPKKYFKSIYLHLQTNNTIGMKFYKRHGFKITQLIEDYYPENVAPNSAYVLERELSYF